MAMLKGVGPKQKQLNHVDAYKRLSAEDKKALPFLTKKCKNKNNPEFGQWQETRLVKHITDRLRLSDSERRLRVQRCTQIDVQLSGVIKYTQDDKKRDIANKRGRPPKAVEISLPFAYAQIDDMVTYLMSIYAAEMDIFAASSTADKQTIAEGLTQHVNKQGQKLQYYREFAKLCLNAIKYNFGGMAVNWEKQEGIIFQSGTDGQVKKANGTLWEGNVLKSVDAYNFFYDTAVHPVDLALRGEYFAEVQPYTAFRVRRMADQNILFGIERFVNTFAPVDSTNSGTFYIAPPIVREPELGNTTHGQTNWQQILAPGGPAQESQPGIELAWFTTWIRPAEFELSESKNLEVWRICLAQGRFIAAAAHIEDTHGQLPCAIATPIEDDLRNDQRTYAEQLLPLQHFASFLLNTHVAGTRKGIYGITVFDANLFPGIDLTTEDLIGERIPMKSSATGIDIDKAFRHYNAAPNTDGNVDMVGKIAELMQQILPTNAAKQVADLERATEYQAAATVQASSRRNLKIARLINDQCLSVIKFQMLYNILAKLTVIEYNDPTTGQQKQIQPSDLLDAGIEFDIATGLRGLDRLMQIGIFKELMGYLFQMKDIGAQVDVLGLLAYVTELAGFKTDLSRFKLQPQTAAGSPQNGQQPASQGSIGPGNSPGLQPSAAQ